MAVYAIGDVQGCFDDLMRLLDKIEFDSSSDTLWFCGDIVNRGPKSLQTLRYIKNLGDKAVTVLGNHDLHLLAIDATNKKSGKKDSLDDIFNADDKDELLTWLRHRPLIHYDKKRHCTMVHASIHPDWTVKQAINYASEVTDVLRSDDYHTYFQHMYGNQPGSLEKSKNHWDRLRFITNVFTRMRFCDAKGRPELKAKGAVGSQPGYMIPWFELTTQFTQQERIIFGHWSTLKDPKIENIYPIDTGCLWGGKLTALKVGKKKMKHFRIKCPQSKAPY